MTATLVLADGSRVRLLPGSHTVGRKAGEADLVVGSEKSISRKHAVLRCDPLPRASVLDLGAEEPGVVLLDSGSTFGTFVNGARLEKGAWCPLQSGDQLAFGSATTGRCTLELAPLVVAAPCLASVDEAELERAVTSAASLGARLTLNWTDGCTHALLPASAAEAAAFPADAVAACALYAGAPVLRLAWLHESGVAGADGEAEESAFSVALTHPATAALLPPPATFPARFRGALLRGVTLLFNGGGGGLGGLADSLARPEANLLAAARLAGAAAVLTGTPQGEAAAEAARAGGAAGRATLLVLPPSPAAAAALRRSAFAAAEATDEARLLATLLSGQLGQLRLAPAEGPAAAGPARGAKRAAAQADDSDTGEEEGGPAPTRTQATGGPAPSGFQPFSGSARAVAEGLAGGRVRPAPPPKPPPAAKKAAAPKGRNAALAIALQMDAAAAAAAAAAEAEEAEEAAPDFYGDVQVCELVVAAPAAAAPRAQPQGFKRFRKVGVLPSSSTSLELLIPVTKEDAHQAREEEAAERATKARAAVEAEARRLFASKLVPQKAKPKSKAK